MSIFERFYRRDALDIAHDAGVEEDREFVIGPGEHDVKVIEVGSIFETDVDALMAGVLGDEPYQYQESGPVFYPNYESVIATHVFPVGGVLRLPWLLEQDRIWVDAWGHIHNIDLMPREYVLNVLILIHEHLGHGTVSFDPYTAPLIQALRDRVLDDD